MANLLLLSVSDKNEKMAVKQEIKDAAERAAPGLPVSISAENGSDGFGGYRIRMNTAMTHAETVAIKDDLEAGPYAPIFPWVRLTAEPAPVASCQLIALEPVGGGAGPITGSGATSMSANYLHYMSLVEFPHLEDTGAANAFWGGNTLFGPVHRDRKSVV